ncbi:MAG: hypothetical protein Q8L79_08560 [Methylobacter sp.]|uniref:hypothetical protein n=1 Tax=Methylobacter sp. TaxID=2051955 RepID=UPI00273072B5|nr:hypothetical protein [Methylobacter sp.]MDP1665167.1 hypothetical protein [Methylobacter sp.]MDP1970270.1 hypothetical protein [Methylobacter sp.]
MLDLGLPDVNRLALGRSRNRKICFPITILTACDEVNDRINGIEQDDMTMPFELRKLGIRARVLIRLCYR